MKKFYTTTAIDYPNGLPHVGHAYEKIVTDTYARWYRYLGYDVRFLTGTDENGQKLVKAAEESGSSDPKEFIDKNVARFRQLCTDLKLTHDDFIRTTEPRHREAAAGLWSALAAGEDIYFDRYSGHYCIGCEAFYLESQAEDLTCPNHGTPLEFVEQDGFFFRMSRYEDWIIQHIEGNKEFIFPASARKEILSRLKGEGLKDLSISRPNAGWGIPVPEHEDHVMYTWFDALINYYAAVQTDDLKQYWPAQMHVIGKDITFFHTVIWPIMLHAAKLPLPQQVHVHGMILGADGRKMSKSLGNVIDIKDLVDHYPNDLLRYHFIRAIPSGGDGRFAISEMIERNNNELANAFGNLALRVIKLTAKRVGERVECGAIQPDFDFRPLGEDMKRFMDAREHNRALDRLWEGIAQANAYLNDHEPWKIKDDPDKFLHHMYNGLYAVHCFATLLTAFLPEAAAKTLKMLGTPNQGLAGLEYGGHVFQFGETESLFPKLEVPESP